MFNGSGPYPSAAELAKALKAKPNGKGWKALCPAHDDHDPSLAINEGADGKVLLSCKGGTGCSQEAVLQALRARELWPVNGKAQKPAKKKIVKTYDYLDSGGNLVSQAVRYEPKGFSQRQPDGKGGWINNVKGVAKLPYRLPELLEAIGKEQTIFVVEGEKDVDNLATIGVVATCNAAGASKWKSEHAAFLKGADVVIIPDNDDAGRQHADQVAQSLSGIAARVRNLDLPGLPAKGDVSDWLEAGGTAEKLWQIVELAEKAEQPRVNGHAHDEPAPESASDWPVLEEAAKVGVIGTIAELATRQSEADQIAVMLTALAWGGACFGRSRYYRVGDTFHHSRIFGTLVGESSRARKGTSFGPCQRIFKRAEEILRARSSLPFPTGLPLNVAHGMSSGEGLIAEIRDQRCDEDKGYADDKRILVVEPEFGSVLRHFQRQGNILPGTLRAAWDGIDLRTMTKNEGDRVTAPHVAIVGHITRYELKTLMSHSDLWGGTANRFLWVAVRRGKVLPFPQPMPDKEVEAIAQELARVILHAYSQGLASELVMTNSAKELWITTYPELTREHPGILGAVTSRAEAQTIRLAMIYTQLAGSDRIEVEHLEAALAMWRYCSASAVQIFGEAEFDPVAQRIMDAVSLGPKTQTELSNLLGRNIAAGQLKVVLDDLCERGRIEGTPKRTGGRPTTTWSKVA